MFQPRQSFFMLIFLFMACSTVFGKVTLPKIFSGNMVIQRDQPINVWGWAEKNEKVAVLFNGKTLKTKAANDGSWMVAFPPLASGGLLSLTVKGVNEIVFDNILIGDVWICSGQSNMEWILSNTKNAKQEIASANHPQIRLFTVEKQTAFKPLKDIKGGAWKVCDSLSVADFSAVAYFFGRKLNDELNVPIGLINTSWGGTNIQTWMSWDVMGKKPAYQNIDFAKLEKNAVEIEKKQEAFKNAFINDKGTIGKWFASTGNADWKPIIQPKIWESTEIGNNDGIVWFKKTLELTGDDIKQPAVLSLGPIDDVDSTYINGKFIGTTNSYNKERLYNLAPGDVKEGENYIVIKVIDYGGGGGLYGKPEQLYLQAGSKKISLDGEWSYRPSVLSADYGIQESGPNAFPSQLFNAMISPLVKNNIKGAIWYQGEANTSEAGRYAVLFPEMINDWRNKWGYEFPFFWVQLANFMAPDFLPNQSDWAELREAQNKTLSVPKTGQAVIIDVGEAEDIHPKNKQDVGYRLALAALKTAYDKPLVYSGPVYKTMSKDANKIILQFSETGSGLLAKDKYGYLKGFSIAGNDKKFYWAQAKIDGDKIIVWKDGLNNPEAVRYAWGNNPDDANLYNVEGLPASPFRTDDWPGITQKD